MIQTPLPPEILQEIFNHLPREDLHNVRLVCKQWYNTANIEAVVINPFFNKKLYKKLMNTFENNPVFAANIKQVVLKVTERKINYWERHALIQNEAGRLASVFACCPNVRGIKIYASFSKASFHHFLDQIQQAIALKYILKLKYVEWNILGVKRYFFDRDTNDFIFLAHPDVQVNLNQVLKKLGSELRRFSVYYNCKEPLFEGHGELDFVFEDVSDNKEEIQQQLKSIEIDCKHCAISKESLSRLVSNGYNSLKDLKLNLTILGRSPTHQQQEELLNKLKKYCESSLKTFNICIRNWDGERVFALDNCTDEKERYSYV